MNQHIKRLDQQLINKIAAGEVVERPASAVKELLENSIDAQATEITLSIEDGGLALIEVADNGKGMSKSDAELVLEQHATSKIITEDDLYNINSLGFRGEALASIASVSTTIINTFDNESSPYQVFTDKDGNIQVEIGKARAQGTTVSVRNIFHKVPARRKFLRSEQTESKYISDIFTSIALSHPDISFKFIKDKKTSIALPSQTLSQRICSIFPSLTSESIIPIQYDAPGLKINGYLGHPRNSRSDTSQQYLFLNQRYIKDYLLIKGIKEGYTSMIMTGKNPIFFISVTIDPQEVDVNIHPRKMEVKFNEPGKIFSALKNATFQTLSKHLQKNMLESATNSSDISIALDDNNSNKIPNHDINFLRDFQPKHKTNNTKVYSAEPSNSIKGSIDFTKNLLNSLYEGVSQPQLAVEQSNPSSIKPIQFFNTYIVFEQEGKLMIVDQHAADERYNFERIADKILNRQSITKTSLLIPISINISADEKQSITTAHNILFDLGFEYIIEANTLQLRTLPEMLLNQFEENDFHDLINDLSQLDEGSDSSSIIQKIQESIIASMACHSSIRAGQKLSEPEMHALINNLFKCKLPYSCPHGRPIIWELTKYDIEKQFKRKL